MRRRLEPLARASMPLSAPPRKTRFGSPLVLSHVHWVEPQLVAENHLSDLDRRRTLATDGLCWPPIRQARSAGSWGSPARWIKPGNLGVALQGTSRLKIGFAPVEQIERLEIRIEELREAIERSRRLMLAGQATGEVENRAPTPEEEARNSCYSSSVDWCAELQRLSASASSVRIASGRLGFGSGCEAIQTSRATNIGNRILTPSLSPGPDDFRPPGLFV